MTARASKDYRISFVILACFFIGTFVGCRDPQPSSTDSDLDADTQADTTPDADEDPDSPPDGDIEEDSDPEIDTDPEIDADPDEDPDIDSDQDSNIEGLIENVTWRLHDTIESLTYVSWNQLASATVSIRFTFGKEEWMTTPEWSLDAGEQERLILGVPYETTFYFQLVAVTKEGEQTSEIVTYRTGNFPETFPQPWLNVDEPEHQNPEDRYLFGSISSETGGWAPRGDYYAVIVDRQARVLWARLTPREHNTMYVRVSYDGDDLLIDDATWWSGDGDRGASSQVHRIKIDDTIIESYATPGLHHAFTETSDGTIVWASDIDEEELRELPPGGEWSTFWNCADFFTEIGFDRHRCQSNALFWHEAEDTFLYSFYTDSFVLEVDHATGDTLRYWGTNLAGYPGHWDFASGAPAFHWQHGVSYTPDGHLMVSSHQEHGNSTGVVREYELDEENSELIEHWSWGVDNGTTAGTAGEAHRLSNGNTLINYGASPKVREVSDDFPVDTPEEDTIIWEIQWEGSRMVGRTVFISDLYHFMPDDA